MKRITTYILFALSMAALSGCDGFLTREPKLSQSTELTLSTYEGLNKATFGAYYYLSSTGWYGCDWVIDSEMRSGNGKKSAFKNSGRCAGAYTWNYRPDATSAMWAYCYLTAAMANNVIDAIPNCPDGSEQALNNLKAECLFLRAFSHFCNVITYAQPYTHQKDGLGVPYVEHTDPNARPARETTEKVYEKIVRDLLEAESIIDPAYVRTGTADALATVNINTIRALLCRVYLYMGEWQNCADYATKVIESGKYTMWTAAEYPNVWTNKVGSGEVIFEIYDTNGNATNGYWDDIAYLTNPDESYGDPQVSNQLYSLYEEGDVRLKTYRTDADKESGQLWTAKYSGKGEGMPDVNNVIIFRLSEMYLNRAEAIVKGANVQDVTAAADLAQITSRRGEGAKTYPNPGMADIKEARRMELAWEGHHIYDLARWGEKADRSDDKDFEMCTLNQEVPFPDHRWALPIPKREMEVNANLEQNPGYEG